MLAQIEKGLYKNKDLASILQISNDKNFKRNIKKILNRNNYNEGVDFDSSKRGCILFLHDLDVFTESKERNINIYLYCIVKDNYFNTMPWLEKPKYLKNKFGIDVSERTLYRIKDILVNDGIIEKDILNFSIWCSEKVNNGRDIIRYKPEDNDEKYQEWKKFFVDYKSLEDVDEDKDDDDIVFREAWSVFHRIYRRYYGYSVKISKIDYVKDVIKNIEKNYGDC